MNACVSRSVALPVLAVVALALLVPAAPAARKSGRCTVKGAHTVKANRLVRAYVKRDREGNQRLFGCWRVIGRKVLVAAAYDDGYVLSGTYREPRLAGRFMAVVTEATDLSCKAACPPDYEPTKTFVKVRDIRSRRVRVVQSRAMKRTLDLSTAGAASWLVSGAGGEELRVIDGAGLGRLIDSGSIDPDFVRLRGLHLEWVNAGAPKTAELTPF